MSKKLYEESNLQAIANAIREKNNTQNQYTPSQMPNAILQIHGEPNLETLTVTENGNYLPSANKDGFSEVAVSVPNSYTNSDDGKVVKNGSLISQTPRAAGITENGTYDTTENNSVVVNVPSGGGSGDEPTVYWGDEEPLSSLGNDDDVYIRGNIYAFRDSGGKVLCVVNKDYVVTNTSQILSTHSSVFQKLVEGPAIAIECQIDTRHGFKGPVLISPVADYIKYTANQTPWGSVEVDGIVWYIGSFNNYNDSEDSPSIPTYYDLATYLGNITSTFDSTYASALIRRFLELAAPSIYGSVYIKINGAWQLMAKELNLETLNATSNGVYVPSLGKDGFGEVIVNASGSSGETASIFKWYYSGGTTCWGIMKKLTDYVIGQNGDNANANIALVGDLMTVTFHGTSQAIEVVANTAIKLKAYKTGRTLGPATITEYTMAENAQQNFTTDTVYGGLYLEASLI